MRVLHIDDDPDQVAVTKTYLELFNPGMEVVSSISPVDFLRMIETKEFDCVLCDYLMPEMNGIELCRLVRKTSDIPFIIYTGQGSEEVVPIAFAAGARAATRETDQYIIRVSDTGTGIPDEARRNLFKPFYSTKPGGMGLGLASAKRMVEVQGGTISLENTDGEGSIFTITLPLKELNP
jgi:CheY-like chemotaxis protein